MDRDDAALRKFARFPRVWLDDATADLTARYWIKGLIEPKTFVVVYGPSGDGKTFFVIDLVMHPACAIPWRGRKVNQCIIVYVACEAGASIARRFVAVRDDKLGDARSGRLPLVILTRGPNLLEAIEVEELMADLKSIAEERDLPLGLIVFDTLARSMAGGDENSAGDMGQAIAAADRIRDELGAATLVIHHSGKDPGRGARGSNALFAAADTVISVIDKVATVEKSRDGISGESFPFSLRVVELGTDEDGDSITTCVVQHGKSETTAKQKAPTGKNQRVVWDVVREVVSDFGQIMPGTSAIPQGAKAASVEAVMARAVPKFPGITAWRAKDRIGQAMVSLQASRLIGCHGDYVWLW